MMNSPVRRTRIKICGLTREQDVLDAVAAGADAVGFVMYTSSTRAVSAEHAASLVAHLPPFVTPVLLFVNDTRERIQQACEMMPTVTLQFHGDDALETPEFCASFERPFIKAARISVGNETDFDLVKYASDYAQASALLLDTLSTGYGGTGKTFNWNAFNWSQLSINVKRPLVLSGGLMSANVGIGIKTVQPWAVDVSSGVELDKGIKDRQKIIDFICAVQLADTAT